MGRISRKIEKCCLRRDISPTQLCAHLSSCARPLIHAWVINTSQPHLLHLPHRTTVVCHPTASHVRIAHPDGPRLLREDDHLRRHVAAPPRTDCRHEKRKNTEYEAFGVRSGLPRIRPSTYHRHNTEYARERMDARAPEELRA